MSEMFLHGMQTFADNIKQVNITNNDDYTAGRLYAMKLWDEFALRAPPPSESYLQNKSGDSKLLIIEWAYLFADVALKYRMQLLKNRFANKE
jgi:hypothetical protein